MQKTGHYQLNQWEKTDRVLMEDFNADNAKIDAALKENKSSIEKTEAAIQSSESRTNAALAGKAALSDLTALQQSVASGLAAAGNCKIVSGSYVGTGTFGSSNALTISFNTKPLFILMNVGEHNRVDSIPVAYVFFQNVTQGPACGTDSNLTVSWSNTGVSWYTTASNSGGKAASYQFNESGKTYKYLMFYA